MRVVPRAESPCFHDKNFKSYIILWKVVSWWSASLKHCAYKKLTSCIYHWQWGKHTHRKTTFFDWYLKHKWTPCSLIGQGVRVKLPCLWLWRGAVCRTGTGKALCTAGRTRSGVACAGWCWVMWRSQRWTSGEAARCTGCGIAVNRDAILDQLFPSRWWNTWWQFRCRLLPNVTKLSPDLPFDSRGLTHLHMSMKSWRTLGLKASKSLKMITTGGCCCSSLTEVLRFFPGVLDFLKHKKEHFVRSTVNSNCCHVLNCKCESTQTRHSLCPHRCLWSVPVAERTERAVHTLVGLSTGLLSFLLVIIHGNNCIHQSLQDLLHQMLQCWKDEANNIDLNAINVAYIPNAPAVSRDSTCTLFGLHRDYVRSDGLPE